MTASRIVLARIALSLCIAMAPGAIASETAPPGPEAQSSSKTEKVRAARASGEWTVEKGESLLRICRLLSDDPEVRRNLAIAILEDNPGAFAEGDRTRIMVGAKLRLSTGPVAPAPSGARSSAESTPAAKSRATVRSAPAKPAHWVATGMTASTGSHVAQADDPPPIPDRAASSSQPKAPVYVDKLIDGGLPGETLPESEEALGEEPLGRRSMTIDVRSEWRKAGNRSLLEGGLGLKYRLETAQWGELAIDADLRDATTRSPSGDSHDGGTNVTLYQFRMPVTAEWLADNTLGVNRSLPANMVSTGFRFNLPSQLLWGAGTSLYTDSTLAYAQAGRGARLVGLSTQQVELDDSRSAIVGAEHQALPWLRFGAQANAFRMRQDDPTSESLALSAELYSPSSRNRLKLVALGDDERRRGYWLEGDVFQGFFHHRYGAYQVDRHLTYSTVPITNDERLAYVRTDYRTRNLAYSLSLDAQETNLDRDPARSGYDSVSAFGNVNLRLSRTLSAGGSVNVRRDDPTTPVASRRQSDSETAFLRIVNGLGTTSLDVARSSQSIAGLPDERVLGLAWNQDWPAFSGINISTTLSRAQESGALGDIKRTVAGLTIRAFPITGVYFDVNVMGVRVDREAGDERNVNASLGATWQFLPDWQAQLYATYNTIEASLADQANLSFRDKSVQVTLRYQKAEGIPYFALGPRQVGVAGNGRISGRVFFDENDDGLRQPGERPAPRVRVLLDGRFPVTTDSEGRFEYPLVTAGQHTIRIAVETVPLPWGVLDDQGVPVAVGVRGDAIIEIALRKIAPN